MLAELRDEGMSIERIDIEADVNGERVSSADVRSIPLTIMYRDEREFHRFVGHVSKEAIRYLMSE